MRQLLSRRAGGALAAYPAAPDGAPVLLIPGFMAGDESLWPLAAHLAHAGYRPCPAGIARNVDCSEATAVRLLDRLDRLAFEHGRRISIVGHSRGGMLARVLAQRRPDLVSIVIALAAPFRMPLRAIHPLLLPPAMALFAVGTLSFRGWLSYSCAVGRCCASFRSDLAAPVRMQSRYVSIYSRRDSVVDWRACLDPDSGRVEVCSSHCGMAIDPATIRVVIRSLEHVSSGNSAKQGPAAQYALGTRVTDDARGGVTRAPQVELLRGVVRVRGDQVAQARGEQPSRLGRDGRALLAEQAAAIDLKQGAGFV